MTDPKDTNQDFDVEEEVEEFQPFDPELISIDTKGVTMDTCLRRLEQGTIILAPDFQREEVWTEEKRCRLIESLILRIPLPMFYVAADEKGVFSVVDGLQRLSTIRSYVLGDKFMDTKNATDRGKGYPLHDLEFWGDKFNGRMFCDLPVSIQNRILETEFTFTIINPGTPEEVKRNIFKRINTGGEPLNAQEIRHALYVGQSTSLLARLAKSGPFLTATTGSVRTSRMADRELVLRSLAFTLRSDSDYPKNNDMDAFLSDTMRIINILPTLTGKDAGKLFPKPEDRKRVKVTDLVELERLFHLGMTRSHALFGEHAFRRSHPAVRRTAINKGLFEAWSTLLTNMSESAFEQILAAKRLFIQKYVTEYLENESFLRAVSRDSSKYSAGVKVRYDKLQKLIGEFTK